MERNRTKPGLKIEGPNTDDEFELLPWASDDPEELVQISQVLPHPARFGHSRITVLLQYDELKQAVERFEAHRRAREGEPYRANLARCTECGEIETVEGYGCGCDAPVEIFTYLETESGDASTRKGEGDGA